MIIKGMLFIAGLCLAVQLTAALFGFIDLRYTFRTEYLRVFRRVLARGAVAALVALGAGPMYRPAFLWGLLCFPLFSVLFFWLGKLYIEALRGKAILPPKPVPLIGERNVNEKT
ncbi:MAG: hypothetical protein GY765_38850 [bacterium]|nr:hypothetical protein [bacterium]